MGAVCSTWSYQLHSNFLRRKRLPMFDSNFSRRQVLKSIAGVAASAPVIFSAPATDIQIVEVEPSYQDFNYRAPMKFGGSVVTRVTLLNVRCTVKGRNGKTAQGFGSMPMGNVWSFPSKKLSYDETLAAMKELSGRISSLTSNHKEWGHPIDLSQELEPQYLAAAAEISEGSGAANPAALHTRYREPFDIALHDAYGKTSQPSSFQTLGPEYLHHDLVALPGA